MERMPLSWPSAGCSYEFVGALMNSLNITIAEVVKSTSFVWFRKLFMFSPFLLGQSGWLRFVLSFTNDVGLPQSD